MHWLNFPVMLVLTWSGLLLYWENNNYSLKIGSYTIFHPFPQGFYEALHLTNRNSQGLAWHLLFMWFFAINGALYVLYTAISGQWRHIVPDRRSWVRACQVVLHDLHLSRFAPPQGKYNAAQKIAYSAVVVMGFLELVTGFALWKPDDLGWLAVPFGGLAPAKFVHFWLTIAFTLYFIIHVTQVARAGWGNFRSMITGYEVVPVLPALVSPAGAAPGSSEAPAVGTGSVVAAVPVDVTEPPLERLAPGSTVEVEGQMHRKSRRSLAYAALAILLSLGAWRWAMSQSAHEGVPSWLEWAAQSNAEEHEKEERERKEKGGAQSADADAAKPDADADADAAKPDADADAVKPDADAAKPDADAPRAAPDKDAR